MPNQYANLRAKIREFSEQSNNPDMKTLAELMLRLATEAEQTDKKAQEAADKYRLLKR